MDPTQSPIQPPSQTPPEVFIPQSKPNYLKIIIFSVLIIITLSLIAYLFFQNQKLQKQVLNPQVFPTIQIPSPTPIVTSISISPDETAGWKTYVDQENNFSFKYPMNYSLNNYAPNDQTSPLLINNRIDWNISQYSAKECRGDCPIITKTSIVTYNKIEFLKIEGWIGSIGGEIPQSYITYETKLPSGKYVRITLWELLRGKSAMAENYFPDRNPQPINNIDVKIFDQILSTFKFADNQDTFEKGMVNGKVCYASDFLPKGEIVAKDITTRKIYSQDYLGSGNGGTENFTFQLPVGIYHFRYQAHVSASDQTIFTSLYHTACATNNEYSFCQSDANHNIINTIVKKNETVSDVALCDYGSTPGQEILLNNSF